MNNLKAVNSQGPNSFFPYVLFLIVLPIFPLLLLNTGSSRINKPELVGSLLIQVYIAIRAGYLSATRRLTTARLFVFAFYYVSSGLATEVSSLLNYHSGLDFNLNLNLIGVGLLLSCLSFVVLDFTLPNSEVQIQQHNIKNTQTKGLKFFLILSSLLLIQYIVGISLSAIFSSRDSVSQNLASFALTSGNNALSGIYVSAAKIFPLIVTAYSTILRQLFTPIFRKIIFANLILLGIVNNPISTPRYQFAIFVVVIIYAFSTSTVNRNIKHLVAMILFVVVVFPSMDFGRTENLRFTSLGVSSIFDQLAKKDFDQILMGTLTIETSRTNPQMFPVGKQILGEIGAFVPRAIWSGKPLDASIPVARNFNLANENLSIPLWAEGYLSFRYAGVFLFPFLLSLSFRRMTRTTIPLKVYVLQSFLLGSIFIILRGTLMQYMGILLAALLTTWIVNRTIIAVH